MAVGALGDAEAVLDGVTLGLGLAGFALPLGVAEVEGETDGDDEAALSP